MTGQTRLIVLHESPLKILGMFQSPEFKDFSIAYASSCADGDQLAKTTKPDLILIDASLKDTSAVEICRQIKSSASLSHCPVLVLDEDAILTGSWPNEFEFSTVSRISGPFSKQDLVTRIQAEVRIKSIQDSLKASEERFQLMYESTPVPYMTLDENGIILKINPACQRLLDYMNAELLGVSLYDLLSPSDADKLRAHFSSAHSQEPIRNIEIAVRRKESSSAFVLFTCFQEVDTRDNMRSMFCILSDVSEKSKTQQSLLKAQQLEFTATLAGGIAHDFNNLLMSIMGCVTLAQLFLSSENKAKDILEKAENTCIQGKELTQQFIILSKCGIPSKKPSSILKLLKGSAVIGIPSPKAELVLDVPDDIWKIEVDEHQMQYALSHLITNAAESMPDGGHVHITIRNIVVSSNLMLSDHPITPGHYLHVRIKDQGQGIASEHLPRIFDPYYTTKELGPKKGMGLGLTTVHSIIHKHDGFIFIESEVNQGTTVDVYLPALSDDGCAA